MSVANITAEGVQQAASIVTGSQSQEKGGQRQVPVSHAALRLRRQRPELIPGIDWGEVLVS